ncbi:MAG: GNAT family N-acetyltransferase [Roseburia sp.]|nr:GNAT family N-acetyltransferase [Roseburia sp.]MCM1098290.1 GNAT family N-acetyltransferase [Ruminococcus flavefaciens]
MGNDRQGPPCEIRWARESEWSPTMQMVWRTFLKFEGKDYSQEGIKNFYDFITDDNLYVAFLRGNYQLMVALDGKKIIGAGSIRNRNHLSLLFVDEDYQRRGVGRAILTALCDYLKREEGERYMSLKAAPYAVNFYRRLGFHTVRPEEEYSGIRVTAMEKIF